MYRGVWCVGEKWILHFALSCCVREEINLKGNFISSIQLTDFKKCQVIFSASSSIASHVSRFLWGSNFIFLSIGEIRVSSSELRPVWFQWIHLGSPRPACELLPFQFGLIFFHCGLTDGMQDSPLEILLSISVSSITIFLFFNCKLISNRKWTTDPQRTNNFSLAYRTNFHFYLVTCLFQRFWDLLYNFISHKQSDEKRKNDLGKFYIPFRVNSIERNSLLLPRRVFVSARH